MSRPSALLVTMTRSRDSRGTARGRSPCVTSLQWRRAGPADQTAAPTGRHSPFAAASARPGTGRRSCWHGWPPDLIIILLHRKLGVLVGIAFLLHKCPPICRPGQGHFSLGQLGPGQPRPALRRFSSVPGSNGACRDCQAQAAAHSQTPAVSSMAACRSNAPTPEMIHFQPGRADRS